MKLLQKNGKNLLVVTKGDWLRMGQQNSWMKVAANNYYSPGKVQDINEVTVQKYGEDYWGVYVNNLLLSVCVYKRGAMSVKNLIEELKIRQLSQSSQLSPVERPGDAQQDAQENDKQAVG